MRRSQKPGLRMANDVIQAGVLPVDIARALRPHMAKVYWESIVGEQVSGATQVLAVRGGDTLVVRTKNSVWMNELTLLKTDILGRLNRAIGGRVLTDIRFEIGKLDPKPAAVEEPARPVDGELDGIALPIDVQARIAAVAGAVGDDDLRDRIRQGLTRAARADRWKSDRGWKPCERCGTLAEPGRAGIDHLCPVCRIDPSVGR